MRYIKYLCEKTVFALFALCFSFVSLYTPQIYTAEAGALGGGSTEITQIANNIILGVQQGFQSISAMANTVTAAMTGSSWLKDNILDGIGWALAKSIVSQMTSSIVNWINSGFQGSPAFITDIEDFLLGEADREFGRYLEELGGPFSFICTPFKLDVRIALSVNYESARGRSGIPSQSTCTLTGAMANIESFIDGTQSFTEAGGWDNWFTITSQPIKYTPYGNLVEAEAQANARIVNARGETLTELNWGGGFLSSKVCEAVEDESGGHSDCTITTPGSVINSALNKSLGAGQDSLIQADEINEIISALFGQLSRQAITGVAGLLGLSGGTGHTYSGVPYTQQLSTSGFTSDPARLRQLVADARAREDNYLGEIYNYESRLNAYASNPLNESGSRGEARKAADRIPDIVNETVSNIATLDQLIADFDAAGSAEPTALQSITERFLNTPVHSESEIEGQLAFWENLLR